MYIYMCVCVYPFNPLPPPYILCQRSLYNLSEEADADNLLLTDDAAITEHFAAYSDEEEMVKEDGMLDGEGVLCIFRYIYFMCIILLYIIIYIYMHAHILWGGGRGVVLM